MARSAATRSTVSSISKEMNSCRDGSIQQSWEDGTSGSKEEQNSTTGVSGSLSKNPNLHSSSGIQANGSRSNTPDSHSVPPSCSASAQTNRSTPPCTVGERSSKERISSAGHTPYSRSLPPEEDCNRPSSSISAQSTPSRPCSSVVSEKKPMSSNSSRVSSAPVVPRSSSSSRQSIRSQIGSSLSQRTPSRSDYCPRPDSRQGTGHQQSLIGSSDHGAARLESPSLYTADSRPSSQLSIASTASTKSGFKSRGIQCSRNSNVN